MASTQVIRVFEILADKGLLSPRSVGRQSATCLRLQDLLWHVLNRMHLSRLRQLAEDEEARTERFERSLWADSEEWAAWSLRLL